MLYALAHILRAHCPLVWHMANVVNSWLFFLRYGKRLKDIPQILSDSVFQYSSFKAVPISECKAIDMVLFFTAQPKEAFTCFRPHLFDEKNLKKLQGYNAFLAYMVLEHDKIVGYFFMRSFFHGKTFIGRMVDVNYRGKGIAKMMNRVTFDIAQHLDLRVFQTISPENISSLKSAEAENELRIIEILPNGDLFVENLPKKK